MPNLNSFVARSNGSMTAGGSVYPVDAITGAKYVIYIDEDADVAYKKSTDGGLTWSAPVIIYTGTATNLAIFYDRWSDISGGLIHIAYTQSGTDDTHYRTIDTESADTLGTQRNIFLGASTAADGHLSIVRARGGNLYCKTVIDAGSEGGFYKSTDSGATWSAVTVDETIAASDLMILMPGFAADSQDILAVFWDASADEIAFKKYDDSADTWTEFSSVASMVDPATASVWANFAAIPDLDNSRIICIAWTASDTSSARLRAFRFYEGGATSVTDVVSSSTDDQARCALAFDRAKSLLYAFYFGKTDGSETINAAPGANLYYKVSADRGDTWGSETLFARVDTFQPTLLVSSPLFYSKPVVITLHGNSTGASLLCHPEGRVPRPSNLLIG